MPTQIIEGIGNEVLLVCLCLSILLVCITIRLFTIVNSGAHSVVHSTIPPINSSNSNSAGREESLSVPSEDDINSYNAGLVSETDYEYSDNHASPCPGTSSDSAQSLAEDQGEDNENKSKIPGLLPGHIILRLQYLDDRVRYVHAPPDMPVIYFKRKFFADEMNRQHKNVRLIFQGRELTSQEKIANACTSSSPTVASDPSLRCLRDYGVRNNSTIHCLISEMSTARTHPASSSSNPGNRERNTFFGRAGTQTGTMDLDFGSHIMLPLFALLIGSAWLFRFAFYEYFTIMSTTALIIISALFTTCSLSIFARSTGQYRPSEPAAGDTTVGSSTILPQSTG